MIHRADHLSSTPTAFSDERNKLPSIFLNLDYPINLINPSIIKFLHNIDNVDVPKNASDDTPSIIIPLPFKDQQSFDSVKRPLSLDSVKRQMPNLSASINVYIKPVYQRKNIGQVLTQKEKKPPIVSNQCPVYKFQCNLCDADYVGYTT